MKFREWSVELRPLESLVVFGRISGGGVLLVKVWLSLPDPRVMVLGVKGGIETPTSIFLSDLSDFVEEARRVLSTPQK